MNISKANLKIKLVLSTQELNTGVDKTIKIKRFVTKSRLDNTELQSKEETLKFNIKPGTQVGKVLRIKGKGNESIDGRTPGDLLIEILQKEDKEESDDNLSPSSAKSINDLDFEINQDFAIYELFHKGHEALERESFKTAIECFDIALNRLNSDVNKKLMATTLFSSIDGATTFTAMDIYHKRGVAKFNISDISSIDDFTKAIKLSKSYSDSYYMRGVARFVLDNDWKSALSDIKKYLTLNPDDKAGNDMLYVLEEIKNNSSKVYTHFMKSIEYYQKGENSLSSKVEGREFQRGYIIKALVNLDEAISLFTQKNRPYIYQKTNSFTLMDIYFIKIKCKLKLVEYDQLIKEKGTNVSSSDLTEMMNLCSSIYNISKGTFKPPKNELGERFYYEFIKKLKNN